MTTPLGQFITDRMDLLRINQTELSRISGVPQTTVNRLIKGTAKGTSADSRRRIAKALGVNHVDLLVAAGELFDTEVHVSYTTDVESDELTAFYDQLGTEDRERLVAIANALYQLSRERS